MSGVVDTAAAVGPGPDRGCFFWRNNRCGDPTTDYVTAPRAIFPGSTYLITRRCTQRQFWLKPSKLTNQIVRYCLGYTAERYGIELHAFCAMSNHIHVVATDVHGTLPEFMHSAFLFISKCVNASYGRWENLWASEPPSAVRLEHADDIVDKIAYALANPVAAGLVDRGRDWPGVRSRPIEVGGAEHVVERPPVFFSETGTMPLTVTLRTQPPARLSELGGAPDRALGRHLERVVARREAKERTAVRRAGLRVLGAAAVLAQMPHQSPQTIASRRTLNPRVAARNKWLRIEALRRVKEFIAAHRAAYRAWRDGQRGVVFPAGTYAMARYHGATVAPL